jgi:hypothetical protein
MGFGALILHSSVPWIRGAFWWEHFTVLAGFVICQIAGRKLAGSRAAKKELWDRNADQVGWPGFWLGIGLFVLNAAIVCGGCTLAVIEGLNSR